MTGSSETTAGAVERMFASMRKMIGSMVDGVIVHMEPNDVVIDEIEEKKIQERFLFIFWPRERLVFSMRGKIKVQVKSIVFE